MDISSLLFTIASLSASFVAILGGFIASRLITINTERASCMSQMDEVRGQLMYYRAVRTLYDDNRLQEDAITYIYYHMAELVDGESLDDVYEEHELQLIEYDDLEPYWKLAQEIQAFFDTCLQDKDCKFNSDMIPIAVAEEYTDDLFAYEFCKLYAGWGFSDYDFDNTPFRKTGKWYEHAKQTAQDYSTQIAVLGMREGELVTSLRALEKPKGMKAGLVLFALFSVFNIILPLVLSLFSFTKVGQIIVAVICILLLTLGLIATFAYLAWMLKWQNKSVAYFHNSSDD